MGGEEAEAAGAVFGMQPERNHVTYTLRMVLFIALILALSKIAIKYFILYSF